MTEEQYNLLKDIYPRRSLYPRERETLFAVHKQIYGEAPPCSTCPATLTWVMDRIYPRVNDYLNEQAQKKEKENLSSSTLKELKPEIKEGIKNEAPQKKTVIVKPKKK